MDRLLRTRLTTVIVLVVVFGSGLLLGLALDRSVVATPRRETARTDQQQSERQRPLYEQVGPSEAQKIAIDSIVQEYRTAMRALHAEFQAAYDPRYEALVQETRAAIKGVLTPEQAHAYDSLVAVRDSLSAERDRQRAGRGPREERDRS